MAGGGGGGGPAANIGISPKKKMGDSAAIAMPQIHGDHMKQRRQHSVRLEPSSKHRWCNPRQIGWGFLKLVFF